jgi:ribose transport system ATP-binding protein/rhamnose transport system ATP-binding protein
LSRIKRRSVGERRKRGAAARATPERDNARPVAIVEVANLCKDFGAVCALRNVSLDIAAGEVRAICGENGAGKSTFVKILTGVYRPDAGSIRIAGQPCEISSPQTAQELGIAFVAQELSLCPDLSVEANIWLGSVKVPLFHRRAYFRRRAREALDLLGATHIGLDTPVRQLGIGERQLVEIARMLTREARVLILDEPTATLSDSEVERIFSALVAIKQQGRSIVYITHRLAEVFQICDTVTVLRNGELVETRPVSGLNRKALIEMMLGRSFVEVYPESITTFRGEAALVIDGLSIPGSVRNFTLSAPRGTVTCIAGQLGSGAADVIDALAGLVYNASGRVLINGVPVSLGSAARALESGIMFVSGDRAEQGIFRHLSVHDNLLATRLGAFSTLGMLRRAALKAAARDLAEQVGVDQRRLFSLADQLSGGNQQKLAFGRCIGNRSSGVLVMNEPTRGIDVGARAEIYRIMRAFCSEGHTLIMTTNDLEEAVGIADIIVTMYRGKIVGCYNRHEVVMHRLISDLTHPTAVPAA